MKQVTHWDLGNPMFSWFLLVQLGFISTDPRCWAGRILWVHSIPAGRARQSFRTL